MLQPASRRAALVAAVTFVVLPRPAPAARGPTTLQLPLQMQAGGVLTCGVFIDGEPAPEVVTMPGWPTLTVPPPCSPGFSCPGTTVPPKVEAICLKWSDAFLAMLKRNGGHLGPYLD